MVSKMAERTVILIDSDGNPVGVSGNPLIAVASGSVGSRGVSVSSEPPEDPSSTPLWVDSDDSKVYYWADSWIEINASGSGISVASIAPVEHDETPFWYDYTTRIYIFVRLLTFFRTCRLVYLGTNHPWPRSSYYMTSNR